MNSQKKLLTGLKNLDLMILANLNDKDLVSVCNTSKRADEICSDEHFWRKRIEVKFPNVGTDVFKKYKGNRTWADYYVHDLVKIARKNPDDALEDAAKNGRLDHLMIAVDRGAYIYVINDAALSLASRNGHLEVVKYLIKSWADIHAWDDAALREASLYGHLEIVKYLIKLGAYIHADDDGALSFASENGHLEIVEYLVSQGANIHADNDEALRRANKNGHLEVVKFLEQQE